MRKLWERVTATMPVIGPDSTGILRIPRHMVSCLSRFVDANALLDGENYPQIKRQFHQMLHAERGEHISPSLVGSAAFMAALCDAAYMAPALSQRQSAHTLIGQLAAARGVDRQRFELMLLPTCGLGGDVRFVGASGQGYMLALGSCHRPLLRGDSGRVRTGTPHGLLPEDRERLKRYKALIGQKSYAQCCRLETAMLVGERWPTALFAQMLAHPLLAHHACHVLWAGYDADGGLIEGFLMQDDGSPVSDRYAEADLSRYAMVGIPHPADVPISRVLAWAELLDDFHVAPLFAQLHRPITMPSGVAQALAPSFASARWDLAMLGMFLRQMRWDMQAHKQVAEYALPNLVVRAVLDLRVDGKVAVPLGIRFERDEHEIPPHEAPPSLTSEVCWHMSRLAGRPSLRAMV